MADAIAGRGRDDEEKADESLGHARGVQVDRRPEAGRAAGPDAGSRPGAGAGARRLAELPRPGRRHRQLLPAGRARHRPAVRRRGRGDRRRRGRTRPERRRQGGRHLLPARPERPGRRSADAHGPAARRHAARAGRHARGRRDQAAGRLFVRGRRLPALRGGDGVALPVRRRQAGEAGRHGAGAGLGRGVGLGAAARQGVGLPGDRHDVARRQGPAAAGARGLGRGQLQDPRGLGQGSDAAHRRRGRGLHRRGRRRGHPCSARTTRSAAAARSA